MLVGGVFALVSLRVALWKGIEAGIQAFRAAASHSSDDPLLIIPSHEQDLPLPLCLLILFCCVTPFYVLVSLFMKDWLYTLLLSFFVLVFGFLCLCCRRLHGRTRRLIEQPDQWRDCLCGAGDRLSPEDLSRYESPWLPLSPPSSPLLLSRNQGVTALVHQPPSM
jgi:hypothetical protein